MGLFLANCPHRGNLQKEMAGQLREFPMPTARAQDGQEAIFKRMRMQNPEPIAGGIILNNAMQARLKELSALDRDRERFDDHQVVEYFLLQLMVGDDVTSANPELRKQWTLIYDKINRDNRANFESAVKVARERAIRKGDTTFFATYVLQYLDTIYDELGYAYPAWRDGYQTPGNSARPSPVLQRKQQQQQPAVGPIAKLEHDLDYMLRAGLQPLYSFVGMLATALGDHDTRAYYAWRGPGADLATLQAPIVAGASTLDEFVERNSHLGRPLLQHALTLIKTDRPALAPIGVEPVVPPAAVSDERFIIDLLDRTFVDQAPNAAEVQWTFQIVDEAVFVHILNQTTLGAIHLAHNKLRRIDNCRNFTLKQLMLSDGVNDIFAKFVAWEFLQSSGGNAYGKAIGTSHGKVKGSNMMLSAGIQTRNALASQVACAQIWFQSVRLVDNPVAAELKRFVERQKPDIDAWEARVAMDEANKNASIHELQKTLRMPGVSQEARHYLDAKLNYVIAMEKLRHLPLQVLRYFG